MQAVIWYCLKEDEIYFCLFEDAGEKVKEKNTLCDWKQMKNECNSSPKGIDLQIFITRTPGSQGSFEDFPSILVTGGGQRENQSVYSQPSILNQQNDNVQNLPQYIAIANSNVIENIELPFNSKEILNFITGLSSNRIKLKGCINFGSKLFDFVFHRSIRDLFRKLIAEDQFLRITIATNIPELSFLPWEVMCDTQPGILPQFLCHSSSIHLSRALHLFDRKEFKITKLGDDNEVHSLRILLVTANPDGKYLDFEAEERLLNFIIHDDPELKNVDFEVIHDANINLLRERLNEFRPHILHLSCHGYYNQEEDMGFVSLCSPNNYRQPDLVNSYRLATVIQEPKSIKIAVISTCYGAFQSKVSAFSGIAQCLHACEINDVVALQFPLFDKTGHAVLLNFYKYLLREQMTVEDSISQVRRYLFINGYVSPECFGLTLYQSNTTQYWPGGKFATRRSEREENDFIEIVNQFEMEKNKIINEKLTIEIDKIQQALIDLDEMTPHDLLLAYRIFDNIDLGLDTLREVKKADVLPSLFLQICHISKILCHTPHEKQLVETAIIIKIDKSDNTLKNEDNTESEILPNDFFTKNIDDVLSKAITVNGEDRVFIVLCNNEGKHIKTFIKNIRDVEAEISDTALIDKRWRKLCSLINDSGCAFCLPGDSRVKILVFGEQLLEYRRGLWRNADLRDLVKKSIEVANEVSIDEKLIVNILKKCIAASEIGRGSTFIIQLNDLILEKCHSYENIDEQQNELNLKKLTDFESKEYLDLIRGDNAIVVSKEGITLAFHAAIATFHSTYVEQIPGTGSRHLSAQKITKETDAIAIVVSEDGPITLFRKGLKLIRIL